MGYISNNRVFAVNLIGFGFFWSVSYMKSIPNPRKTVCCGKTWHKCHFDLIFLGLGWPWVGEFVGFIITRICVFQPDIQRTNSIAMGPASVTSVSNGSIVQPWGSRADSKRRHMAMDAMAVESILNGYTNEPYD